jgi:hypothetical protein
MGQAIITRRLSPDLFTPFEWLDNFNTNTLSEYVTINTRTGGTSNWSISNNSIAPPTTNSDELLVYDIRDKLERYSKITVEASVVSGTSDDDGIAVCFANSDLTQTYNIIVTDDYPANQEGLSIIGIGDGLNANEGTRLAAFNKTLASTNNLKLDYDGTTLRGYWNGTLELQANVNFNPGYAGIHTLAFNPVPRFGFLKINVD